MMKRLTSSMPKMIVFLNKLNDITELHRNLKIKEKKLEFSISELKTELDEIKRKNANLDMELEMTKSQSENDLNTLINQRKDLEDELEQVNKEKEANEKSQRTAHQSIIDKHKKELDNINQKLTEAENNLQNITNERDKLKLELTS